MASAPPRPAATQPTLRPGQQPGQQADQGAVRRRAGLALCAVSFFMADIQAGAGPFLGVFLLARHWGTGAIGTVMTLAGIAGMLCTVPAGALIDATTHKRPWVMLAGLCTMAASLLLLLSTRPWVVGLSQVSGAIAGSLIVPAVTGITLGVARQRGFNRQNGLNQAFNHAGNMAGAVLGGLLGWKLGLSAVFRLDVAFGALAIATVLLIPARAIDDQAARGLGDRDGTDAPGAGAAGGEAAEGFGTLLRNRPMLVLAASLACFHLGNGAMLPLYGMAVSSAGHVSPALFTGATVAVAQAVMIVAALVAMRVAERHGTWLILLATFLVLPVRGLLAADLVHFWGVLPVQALDGIGAGLQSVAVPSLVARLLRGTGRVNVGQAAVMTVQGVGAALSPAIGGWIVAGAGYHTAFIVLGSFSLGALALWVGAGASLREACAPSATRPPGTAPA